MEHNADFTARTVVHAESLDWIESPMKGVHRRLLDRVGGEVARATSCLLYTSPSPRDS